MTLAIKHFTQMNTWRVAHRLVLSVYRITSSLPNAETFGLAVQMNRSAVSITSNMAEGFGRNSYKEKNRFYYIARGSLFELENQLIVAADLRYISTEVCSNLANQTQDVHRLLNGLIRKTRTLYNLKRG